jgi:hypothetical protein
MKVTLALGGLRTLDCRSHRTLAAASFAFALIAMEQGSSDARPANDFMAEESGDALCAIAPENDFFLKVDHANTHLQALQEAAANLGILECGHGEICPGDGATSIDFIGTIYRDFRKGKPLRHRTGLEPVAFQ